MKKIFVFLAVTTVGFLLPKIAEAQASLGGYLSSYPINKNQLYGYGLRIGYDHGKVSPYLLIGGGTKLARVSIGLDLKLTDAEKALCLILGPEFGYEFPMSIYDGQLVKESSTGDISRFLLQLNGGINWKISEKLFLRFNSGFGLNIDPKENFSGVRWRIGDSRIAIGYKFK